MDARKLFRALLVASLLVAPAVALAAAGDLDPSYGTTGSIEFTVEPSGEPLTIVSMHVDDDGSAIVVGSHEGNSLEQYLWVGRVSPSGTSVAEFQNNGPGGAFVEGSAVTVSNDGRVTVVGNVGGVGGTGADMFAHRFLADGTADTSFSGDGAVVVDTGNSDWATSVFVEADGSVVVAGFTNATTPASVRMARLTPAGALDASFGPLGIVTLPWEDTAGTPHGVIDVDLAAGAGGTYLLTVLGTEPGSIVGTMIVDRDGNEVNSNVAWQTNAATTRIDTIQRDDGKVVAAAHAFDPLTASESVALLRFNDNGTTDASFGSGATPVSHPIDDKAVGTRVALTENRTGELIVAYDVLDGDYVSRLQAFTEDGAAYPEWGTDGIVDIPSANWHVSRDLGTQATGGVLLLGWDIFDVKAVFGSGTLSRVTGDDSGRFIDDDGNTHEANIERLFNEGITSGCDPENPSLYCPADPITRAQMATFLVRAADIPPAPDEGPFVDALSSPHAANVAAIEAAGITEGCSATNPALFCPNDTVTRGQMATFLVRAFDLDERFVVTDPDPFADENGNTHEANINLLYATGVTTGCDAADPTRYCPLDPVSRAQMATFVIRTIDLP
jgi:uncharacterized delta-60 repeat protein